MANRGKNANGNGGPVLQFEHVERRESAKYQVDVRVLEMLEKYPDYIAELTGHKPPIDQVVEKALEQVLNSDAGFKKYLNNGNGKAAARNGNQTANGASGNAKSAAQTA